MSRLIALLLALCFAARVAAAGEPVDHLASRHGHDPRNRALAIGLLIGGGVCLALGATFAGLAAKANGDALSGSKYHPDQEDRRDAYQAADTGLFVGGAALVVPGLVLLW